MCRGIDGWGESLYSVALMTSGPGEIERKPRVNGNVVTILVDSGASCHYFDDLIILELKHCLPDYTSLSTPLTIRTAWEALLVDTAEGVLQSYITDNCGEPHLVGIAIVIVPGIGRNLFSVKTAARTGIVSIFDVNNPRLEAAEITVPLRGEDNSLYSFKLDLSVDGYAGKELVMNAILIAPSVAPTVGSPQQAQP